MRKRFLPGVGLFSELGKTLLAGNVVNWSLCQPLISQVGLTPDSIGRESEIFN